MKAFGYQKDSEELLELCDVSIYASIGEIEKIIQFLQEIKIQHSEVVNGTDICHTHFRDWDIEWDESSPDIIVATVPNA